MGQPEAPIQQSWEVSPVAVGRPASLFTWESESGTATNYPNTVGQASAHGNGVAANYYGTNGAAPGVAHVDNYEANYFISNYVSRLVPISGVVVNQSFIITNVSVQQAWDSAYDDYAATYGTLFCSGAGNSGIVSSPATAYNGIGVGALKTGTSTGPTADNGRCKPDITAPGSATSFTTPYVSGIAALLIQASWRGDGGADTNAASDVRTIKALLLNGAVKPTNWSHTASAPLDLWYGAGIVNAFNSYTQLAAGRHSRSTTTTVSSGGAHPPLNSTNYVASVKGWDFASITNSSASDTINHYCFNFASNNAPLTLTATLTWNRNLGQANINGLDLFLYDMASGQLTASSTSAVDNVEHLCIPSLAAGRYDLQVLKNGGSKRLTRTETYALAFEFSSQMLTISQAGATTTVSWPLAPAGFVLKSATNLIPPVTWISVTNAVVVTNGLNRVNITSSDLRFFRLAR